MFSHTRRSTSRFPIEPTKYRTRVHIARFVSVAIVLAALAYPAQAQEKGWSWGPEMRLNLVNANPWVIGIHPDSGWQMTVDMQVKNRELLGIGVEWFPPYFPRTDTRGFLVLDDPDHCPSFIPFSGQFGTFFTFYCSGTPDPELPDCVPPDWRPTLQSNGIDPCAGSVPAWLQESLLWEKDETWVEFTPGLSVTDPVGTGSIVPIEDTEEERPLLWKWGGGWQLAPYGPYLGTVGDDVGYGSWRRMPGLVVVADHGPGVRFNLPAAGESEPAPDYFDLIEPHEAWNMAGFFQSAAYSLMGGTRETSLMAHMNVPYGVFAPVILFDNNISLPTVDDAGVLCGTDDALYRLDGGPLTCWEGGGSRNIDPIANQTIVTVRVFMLDGVAPDILVDMDGNGRIDIHDAELMGYDPVSSQQTIRFKQYFEILCDYPYDFDNDGTGGTCVAGARPGGLTQPPR